jgi:vancomycin resistance protein VanW
MKQRKLLSQRHPLLYFLSVWLRRFQRYSQWYFTRKSFAHYQSSDALPIKVKKHQSLLIRKLGESEIQLQLNKITNLKIAIKNIDGIIIHPGETFSFCKLVGRPTAKKGYVLGMELSFGKARPGIGGGICQIANMLHWLVLHSPLIVVEKSNHSFDPFPDEGRTLPFGSGAAIFYNYIDFQFKNETQQPFQIVLKITDTHLQGELRTVLSLPHSYHVYEDKHRFIKKDENFYRENEIWRNQIDKRTGHVVQTQLMKKNFARVVYVPEKYETID